MSLFNFRSRGVDEARLFLFTLVIVLASCARRVPEPARVDGDAKSSDSGPTNSDSKETAVVQHHMVAGLADSASPEKPTDNHAAKERTLPAPSPPAALQGTAEGRGAPEAASGAGFGSGYGRLAGSHSGSSSGLRFHHLKFNTERYAHQTESDFVDVTTQALSTFSADVDTASYSNVRRFLNEGSLPPQGAVRIEELLNYFSYDYPVPQGEAPFFVHTEVSEAPWNPAHKLVHVGIKSAEIQPAAVPPRNLVFLLDVSGSMRSPDKLPLLTQSMKLLVRQLRPQDSVAIVVYAGAAGIALLPTSGAERGRIEAALSELRADGGTNGARGILTAYDLAAAHFKNGGINRVILATDGDFNLGTTSESELVNLIEKKRKTGVYLTVLGLGRGNLNDSMMEKLADKGNGNYAYLDSYAEAKKVLEKESGATLVTVAQDVKFQAEFNPQAVQAYRLIGYENRLLAAQDFNDDTKDAGEVGAGHTVTALYEVIPRGVDVATARVDPLKYQKTTAHNDVGARELMTIKLRYKKPGASKSIKILHVVVDEQIGIEESSRDHRFATAVAEFGLLLGDSDKRGRSSWSHARTLAQGALGSNPSDEELELLLLITKAQRLSGG